MGTDQKNKADLIKIYKKTVLKNLKYIETILQQNRLNDPTILAKYEDVLNKSTTFIVDKWNKRTKYLRTEFAIKILGDFYPTKTSMLETSIIIDSMVNILDDLLDEQLDKKVKANYIMEYSRVFAIYSQDIQNESTQKYMAKYFNELITLALAEQKFLEEGKKTKSLEQLAEISCKMLLIRGMDIDIFMEIPLAKRNTGFLDNVVNLARVFRALNIFKKDIVDIEHDKETHQESLVTVAYDKKVDFLSYVKLVINGLESKVKSIKIGSRINNDIFKKTILKNIQNMILTDKQEIIRIVEEEKT